MEYFANYFLIFITTVMNFEKPTAIINFVNFLIIIVGSFNCYLGVLFIIVIIEIEPIIILTLNHKIIIIEKLAIEQEHFKYFAFIRKIIHVESLLICFKNYFIINLI